MKSSGFRLTPRDAQILGEIYAHRAILAQQLVGLGYFQTIIRARARLRQLGSAGLIERVNAAPVCLARSIFRATRWAAPVISEHLGLDPTDVRRNIDGERSLQQLEHTLRITDFRIAVQTQFSQLNLGPPSWLPELLCRHEYLVPRRGSWQPRVFKPDGFFSLEVDAVHHCFFVEIDLGHVSREKFRAKLASYAEYSAGVFQETYGQAGFEVLVITTGPKRLSHLLELTGPAGSVLGTTFDEVGALDALGPVWHSRHDQEPRSLIAAGRSRQ